MRCRNEKEGLTQMGLLRLVDYCSQFANAIRMREMRLCGILRQIVTEKKKAFNGLKKEGNCGLSKDLLLTMLEMPPL